MDLWTFDAKHEKLVKRTTKKLYKQVLLKDIIEQDTCLSSIEDINQLYDVLYSLSIHSNHDRVGLLWKIIQTLTTHLENQIHTSKSLEKQTKTLQQLLVTTETMLESTTHMDVSPRAKNSKSKKELENGSTSNTPSTFLFGTGSPAIRGSTEFSSNYTMPPALKDSTSSQSSAGSSPLQIPKSKSKSRSSALETISSAEDNTSPRYLSRRRNAALEASSPGEEISFDTLSAYKIPTK